MKATKFFTVLSLQIIALGLTGMFGTFLGEYLESINWFNDVYTTRTTVWSARHCWYFWMFALLVLTQIGRIILWAVNYWED